MDSVKDVLRPLIVDYLRHKGINEKKPFKCLNPVHSDNRPSMRFDPKRNKVHCFSCNTDYDLFDLIGIDYGIVEFPKQMEEAKRIFNIECSNAIKKTNEMIQATKESPGQKDYAMLLKKAYLNVGQTNYWKIRGLSKEIIDRFRLGYLSDYEAFGRKDIKVVTIPCGRFYYTARLVDEGLNAKYHNPKGAAIKLFNKKACRKGNFVFVTEGAIDAMSIESLGFSCVGLNSISNTSLLKGFFEEAKLNPKVIIAFDNDKAGKGASEVMEKQLNELGITCIIKNLCGEFKDVNERLIKDSNSLYKELNVSVREVGCA